MFADPSKLTPAIVRAVANVVAVAARATAIFAEPSKEVPPIVLAVARVVAVDAAIPRASISDFVWSAVAPLSIPSSLDFSVFVKSFAVKPPSPTDNLLVKFA